jgi:hypothetical protein
VRSTTSAMNAGILAPRTNAVSIHLHVHKVQRNCMCVHGTAHNLNYRSSTRRGRAMIIQDHLPYPISRFRHLTITTVRNCRTRKQPGTGPPGDARGRGRRVSSTAGQGPAGDSRPRSRRGPGVKPFTPDPSGPSGREPLATPPARAGGRPGSAAGVIDTPGLRDSTTHELVVWVVWVGGGMRSPSGDEG